MTEYIDKSVVVNALIAIENLANRDECNYRKSGEQIYRNLCETEISIGKMMPADVAPVIHGRWVDNGIPDSMLSGCSVCGFRCGAFSFKYCPACGAKMDGEDSETDTRRGTKKPSAQPSNEPLTLDELREMDKEPVWVVQPHKVLPPFLGIVDTEDELVANFKYCANFEDYDTEWLAYRRKPEEGTV